MAMTAGAVSVVLWEGSSMTAFRQIRRKVSSGGVRWMELVVAESSHLREVIL
jgi:hypothetical protein